MYRLTTGLALLLASACTQAPATEITRLQKRVDSLENELKHTYKPGLGEMMNGIQIHHAKLWFAGSYEIPLNDKRNCLINRQLRYKSG